MLRQDAFNLLVYVNVQIPIGKHHFRVGGEERQKPEWHFGPMAKISCGILVSPDINEPLETPERPKHADVVVQTQRRSLVCGTCFTRFYSHSYIQHSEGQVYENAIRGFPVVSVTYLVRENVRKPRQLQVKAVKFLLKRNRIVITTKS